MQLLQRCVTAATPPDLRAAQRRGIRLPLPAARLQNLREDQDDGDDVDEDEDGSETVSEVSEFEVTSQDEGAAARRDWSSMRLTVLQKSGEKSLQFQFGPALH